VRVLADAGVDVNEEGGVRGTALVSAASSGDIEMIDLLFELGVPTGNTQDMLDALVIVTRKQDELLIRHVLDHQGAELDYFGHIRLENWTPLSVAAFKGNQALVEMFLSLGADANADAGIHRTPLIAAIDSDHCNHKVLKILIAAGANVNEAVELEDSSHAGSAHLAAVRRADMKAITVLLDHGADTNTVNGCLYSPLMDAVNMRDRVIIDSLIEREQTSISPLTLIPIYR
jgi:ankyrin repeat protein